MLPELNRINLTHTPVAAGSCAAAHRPERVPNLAEYFWLFLLSTIA